MDTTCALDALITALRRAADPDAAAAMSAYMKDRFPFLGLQSPVRRALSRPFFAETRTLSPDDVVLLARALLDLPEREFHYVAADLLDRRRRSLTATNILAVEGFIDLHPWWDSVDALRKPIGLWTREHRETHLPRHERLLAGSMWQRRVAITLQLQWKDETDTALLADAIVRTRHEKEFFIQKAIGWALRDYSKTDPEWVRELVVATGIDGLARREASKYL